MNAYRRLSDGLPKRSKAPIGGLPTDARAAHAWVAGLPLANRAQAGAQILEALHGLNGMLLKPRRRLDVLEAIRPPLCDLEAFIERQILGSSFPLPASRDELGQRAHAFHSLLALGYRMVVVDYCARSGSLPWLRAGKVALALQRALHHQAAALACRYRLYLKPAAGDWAPLHDLAVFGARARLANRSVRDPVLRRDFTLMQVYRQAILFALCNPYRFTQREQVELGAATTVFGDLCTLGEGDADGEGSFPVPVGEDRGPGYLPSERETAPTGCWRIDVSRLRSQVEQQIADGAVEVVVRGAGGRHGRLGAELARRCLSAWAWAAERNHQRLPAGHQLDSIVGLSAVHFFLAGEQDFDAFMRQAHGAGAMAAAGEAAAWTGTETGRPNVFRAVVLDQSLGGYQLAWNKSHRVRARVGELVGLSVPGDGNGERDWMPGIIRWLRYDPEGALEAGVELLSRRARAVGLRQPNGGESTRAALRGIEFRRLRDAQALHVLAPSVFDGSSELIEITRGVDPFDIEAEPGVSWLRGMRTVEHTGDYLLLAGALGDNGSSDGESTEN